MFELNKEILNWRDNLAKSEAMSVSAIDELESHLREQIESLASGNLSEEESFWIARRRLGSPGDLAGEFAKINKSAVMKSRLFWMAGGVLAYMLAIQSGAAASRLGALLAAFGGVRGSGLGLVAAISELLVLGLILYLTYRIHRRICNNSGFSRWASHITVRITLFATLAVSFVAIALAAAQIVGSVAAVRLMGASEYAQAATGSNCVQLALNLLLPGAMVVMMILLRRSRSNEIGA